MVTVYIKNQKQCAIKFILNKHARTHAHAHTKGHTYGTVPQHNLSHLLTRAGRSGG